MDREFIPYEEALALKELGFDEKHYGVYGQSPEHLLFEIIGDKFDVVDDTHFIKAPLYQQAFRWFREKHNLSGNVDTCDKLSEWNIKSSDLEESIYSDNMQGREEAELSCLRKLIQIVKSKEHGTNEESVHGTT